MGMPSYYRKNIAVNAARRHAAPTKSTDKVGDNREAVGSVICMCIIAAMYDRFSVGEKRLEKVTNRANVKAEAYQRDVHVRGVGKAKKKLQEDTEPYMPGGFVLPAGRMPKNNEERAILYERRDAAEIVVRAYALAMHEVLGFGEQRITAAVAETRKNYEQFLDYAKEGDMYGYELLRRKMAQILDADVQVVQEDGHEPVFSGRYY